MAKDSWDKLDTVGKIISSLVLVVIAMFIKTGSERIAFSLQSGQLVQSLISDLTTKEQQTRQDVALLALDNSIGDEKPQMVAAIAERLFRDTQEQDSARAHALGSVAFRVLERRDPQRAEAIRASLDSLINNDRAAVVSNPDTAVAQTAQAPVQSQLITRVFNSIVYVQFRNENERRIAQALRDTLNATGLHSPAIDQEDGNYRNWVRYFHADDRGLATTAADLAAAVARKNGHTVQFKVQDLSGNTRFRAGKGHVEVWINLAAAPIVPIPSRPR
jgi:hypothetical protein